ncbi:MAG: hypothetical protein HY958_02395 [Bacteroidia bacterium]|nr:hypothetical protein [Bacteroidia bacterium]
MKADLAYRQAELFYSAFLSLPETEKENFLSRLLNSLNDKAIAFTSKGKPLTKKQYVQHIETISKDVKKGNFISHEQLIHQILKLNSRVSFLLLWILFIIYEF